MFPVRSGVLERWPTVEGAAMDLQIRAIEPDEVDAVTRVVEAAFGGVASEGQLALERSTAEPERTIVSCDGPAIVGSTTAYSMDLTVPGGSLPMAGVSGVGVLPTHRRRGVLTSLMRRQLDDLRDREPLAGLWASEGGIYQRFGYGLGAFAANVRLERAHGALLRAPQEQGRLRLADRAEAIPAIRGIFDRLRPSRPGWPSRTPAFTDAVFTDLESHRHGWSELFFALHDGPHGPDGYVAYRIDDAWDERGPRGTVRVSELVAESPATRTSLWRFLQGIDLMSSVKARNCPADEPLLWLAAEPRRLSLTLRDGLWLRLVDVPAALAGRTYPDAGRLVLDVHDATCPWNEGRFVLEAGEDGQACERTGEDADLSLDAADLGALYLGAVTPSQLAAAGRVVEDRPGALERADRMFAAAVAPWCPYVF